MVIYWPKLVEDNKLKNQHLSFTLDGVLTILLNSLRTGSCLTSCHHGMARPRDGNVGDAVHTWRVTATIWITRCSPTTIGGLQSCRVVRGRGQTLAVNTRILRNDTQRIGYGGLLWPSGIIGKEFLDHIEATERSALDKGARGFKLFAAVVFPFSPLWPSTNLP
jgi:hypothetical protein